MTRILSRRRFITAISAAGSVLAVGVLAACGTTGGSTRPAAKGQPTLIPTVLPTAAPAGAARPTTVATPSVIAAPTSAATGTGIGAPQGSPTAIPSTAARRELVILQTEDVLTLDPARSGGGADVNALFALFDTLTFRNEDQSVIRPMLATEWKVQERRWELRLRPNTTFHDGSPLTSADVKFSIERTLHQTTTTQASAPADPAVFSTVERIETPDPLSVAFTTRQPDPLLPARLAVYRGQIVPKAYVERVGEEEFQRRPVGTGPFRFGQWLKGNRLTLERYDGYWGGPAAFERIVFRPQREMAARVAALLAGEAGLVPDVPANQLEAVNRSGRARIDGALFNGLHVLAVNSQVQPLDRPLLKQALSLAIDREEIIKTVLRGQGVVPNGLIAQGEFGFDATLPPLEYHLDRARQRLRASGYAGEPIVLETTQGYLSGDREMAGLVNEMWRKIGINSHVEVLDGIAYTRKLRDRVFKGLFWSAPTSTVLDPDGMMFQELGPGGSQQFWVHREWQQLGTEARSSLDQDLRLRSYRRMNEIALEHLPWIPVVQPRRLYGIGNTVDFRPYGNGYLNLRRENLKPRA